MTTHRQQRILGLLRNDWRWDRTDPRGLWQRGWFDGLMNSLCRPRYLGEASLRYVPTKEPFMVMEYRRGYRSGQASKKAGKNKT